MKLDVPRPTPAGDWTEDAITSIDPRGPRAVRHRNLLRAVLLLHSHALWTNEMRGHWRVLTGRDDASAKALCEAIREAGISVDDMLR